jgi:hypothetical protein
MNYTFGRLQIANYWFASYTSQPALDPHRKQEVRNKHETKKYAKKDLDENQFRGELNEKNAKNAL